MLGRMNSQTVPVLNHKMGLSTPVGILPVKNKPQFGDGVYYSYPIVVHDSPTMILSISSNIPSISYYAISHYC